MWGDKREEYEATTPNKAVSSFTFCTMLVVIQLITITLHYTVQYAREGAGKGYVQNFHEHSCASSSTPLTKIHGSTPASRKITLLITE